MIDDTTTSNKELQMEFYCNAWKTVWSPTWDQEFTGRLARDINEDCLWRRLAVDKAALCIVQAERNMQKCDKNTLEWYMAFESHKHNTLRIKSLISGAAIMRPH